MVFHPSKLTAALAFVTADIVDVPLVALLEIMAVPNWTLFTRLVVSASTMQPDMVVVPPTLLILAAVIVVGLVSVK